MLEIKNLTKIYKGGKEAGREKQSEVIVEDSVDEIVNVGTKNVYRYT